MIQLKCMTVIYSMSVKPQGAGSIWNPNSWHWEMKNYTTVSKKLIEDKVAKLDIKDDTFVINNSNTKFNKAEAEVSIRKGKQHLVYEFEIEVSFVAKYRSELASGEPIEGSYSVKEIASDDLTDITIDDVKTTAKGDEATKVKTFIKKHLKNYYMKLFESFAEDLAVMEGDPQKLEEDRKKREEASFAMQKAKEEKGAEKEKLLEEQKLRERQMKEEFAKPTKKE